jgi:hypothetical protein
MQLQPRKPENLLSYHFIFLHRLHQTTKQKTSARERERSRDTETKRYRIFLTWFFRFFIACFLSACPILTNNNLQKHRWSTMHLMITDRKQRENAGGRKQRSFPQLSRDSCRLCSPYPFLSCFFLATSLRSRACLTLATCQKQFSTTPLRRRRPRRPHCDDDILDARLRSRSPPPSQPPRASAFLK